MTHIATRQIDAETEIRITRFTCGWTGAPRYHAVPLINGYEAIGGRDAATADDAYHRCREGIMDRRELADAAAALTAAGVYADLTTGPRQGIHRQLAEAIPSPTRPGDCPTCGLNPHTCDCI